MVGIVCKADTNYSSPSLPSTYGFSAACHILTTVTVFVIYFYISDSVERAGHLVPPYQDSYAESARN